MTVRDDSVVNDLFRKAQDKTPKKCFNIIPIIIMAIGI